MSFNLLDSVKGLFNNELLSRAGSLLGENEGNLQKAVSGIIPAVLAGILNKAGSGDAGGLLSMAKNALGSGAVGNLGTLLGTGSMLSQGSDLLKGLFGDKTGNVAGAISGYAGIKESSANSLLSAAAPAALGVLGKHAAETNMGTGELLSFLNTQKDSILNSVPSGLNLAGALGLGSLSGIGSKLSGALSGITGSARDITNTAVDKAAGGAKWVLPLILAIAAIVLIWYFARSCNSGEVKQEAAITDTPAVTTPAMPVETLKVTLPDGVVLDASKGGVEDKLVSFLNDPSTQGGKDIWFDFDNLNFETGSAELTPESNSQVSNIVAILKAYPALEVKIGGYTDKTGDSLSNLALSQSRADAVVTAIKAAGASASQVTGGEGYGSQFAKTAADAPDGERQKDRRIAISVRKK